MVAASYRLKQMQRQPFDSVQVAASAAALVLELLRLLHPLADFCQRGGGLGMLIRRLGSRGMSRGSCVIVGLILDGAVLAGGRGGGCAQLVDDWGSGWLLCSLIHSSTLCRLI